MYTEHLRIPVGAGSLHAERVGRGGQPVVLLHGFGTCAFLWRAVGPRLADAGHTAIAIDLLGHGESDRPLEMTYGLAAQADYVERALTALRLPAVTVVGQDVGALVAMLLAAARPRLVRQLVLLNPPDPDDLPSPEIRLLQRTSARAALSANALFGALPLLDPLLRGGVHDPAAMSDRLVARYLAPFVGREGVAQLLALASAIELPDDEGRWLREVRAPVQLFHGERDRWTSRAALDRLAARLTRTTATVIAVPDAGHLIPEDVPAFLTDHLLALVAARADTPATGAPKLQENSLR